MARLCVFKLCFAIPSHFFITLSISNKASKCSVEKITHYKQIKIRRSPTDLQKYYFVLSFPAMKFIFTFVAQSNYRTILYFCVNSKLFYYFQLTIKY